MSVTREQVRQILDTGTYLKAHVEHYDHGDLVYVTVQGMNTDGSLQVEEVREDHREEQRWDAPFVTAEFDPEDVAYLLARLPMSDEARALFDQSLATQKNVSGVTP